MGNGEGTRVKRKAAGAELNTETQKGSIGKEALDVAH